MEIILGREERMYLNLILEGRIDDLIEALKSKNPKLISEIDYLVKNDPTGRQKHLAWSVLQLKKREKPQEIIKSVKTFEDLLKNKRIPVGKRELSKRKFPTLKSLTTLVTEIGNTKSEGQKKREERVKVYAETDFIKLPKPLKGRFVITIPRTEKASCYIGRGTKWCTAAKGRNYFNQYGLEGNVTLYYVIDKSREGGKGGDPFAKVAFALYSDGEKFEIFDSNDRSLSLNQLPKEFQDLYKRYIKPHHSKLKQSAAREYKEEQRLKTLSKLGLSDSSSKAEIRDVLLNLKSNFTPSQIRDFDFGAVDFRGVDLSGFDLEGANLSGVDLRGVNLEGVNLSKSNLKEANLQNVNLKKAKFIDANLSGVNLKRADLSGADLSGANLSGVDLSGANLEGANLIEANLERAKLATANLEGAELRGANLSKASFYEANLEGAKLEGAYLYRASLVNAKLEGANLEGANLTRAWFIYANLTRSKLATANLEGVSFYGANLSGVNLRRANLRGVDLSEANLSGANLNKANLHFADLEGANLSGANLSGVNLRRVVLHFANLSGVKYDDSTLFPEGFNMGSIKESIQFRSGGNVDTGSLGIGGLAKYLGVLIEAMANFEPDMDAGTPSSSHTVQVLRSKLDGSQWFSKTTDEDLLLVNEYLSYLMYKAFGVRVAENALLMIHKGRLRFASQRVKGKPVTSPLKELPKSDFKKGMFVDAFLGNWDVVGNAPRYNVFVDPETNIASRIDTGGFDFRAMGGRKGKGFGPRATELATFAGMRGPAMMQSKSAQIFTKMNQSEIEQAARIFQRVPWSKVKGVFGKVQVDVDKLGDGKLSRKTESYLRKMFKILRERYFDVHGAIDELDFGEIGHR